MPPNFLTNKNLQAQARPERKFVFGNRVIDHWNGLSDSCVNCSTINDFKSKIKVELEPEL